jgi:hypothetical protein
MQSVHITTNVVSLNPAQVNKNELFLRQYFYICSVGYRSSKGGLGLWFYAILNNISAILWRSVLLVQETGGPGESHSCVQAV